MTNIERNAREYARGALLRAISDGENDGRMSVYSQWLDSCQQCGIPAISTDKAAKILAMVYVLGGSHSSYTYSTRLRSDLEYIKSKFHIGGSETPDARIIPLIRQYSQELETAYANATQLSEAGLRINWYPEWATRIAREYNLPANNSILYTDI